MKQTAQSEDWAFVLYKRVLNKEGDNLRKDAHHKSGIDLGRGMAFYNQAGSTNQSGDQQGDG